MAMTTPTTTLTPARDKVRDPLRHVRCCKAAEAQGLCGVGGPPKGPVFPRPSDAASCSMCHEMWAGGHHAVCPMDSRYWNEGP